MPPENRRRRKPRNPEPDLSAWSPEDRAAYEKRKKLQMPIAEAGVSVRVVNTLEEQGMILVEHVLQQSRDDLMSIKNFGERTLVELRRALRKLGLAAPANWSPSRKAAMSTKSKKIVERADPLSPW